MILAESQPEVQFMDVRDVAPGGSYHVFGDAQTGVLDFTTPPLTPAPLPAWPDKVSRLGAGMGPAGVGPAGRGRTKGPGAGAFPAGAGLAGVGQRFRSVTLPPLLDGVHQLAVVSYDAAGNRDTASAPVLTLELAGTPRPPSKPDADADLLHWRQSPDDR